MAEYEVTGVRYQMGDNLTLEQKTQKAEEFIKTLQVGEPLILAAEPDNPKDCEAIAVYRDFTRRVGYIKHERCKDIKPLLDATGQCDAVVSGDDGHVTFFVEIPNAPESAMLPTHRARVLPESPLPQGIGLAYSDEERALQIVAPRIAAMKMTVDNIETLLSMVERYMPLSSASISYDDDYWRDRVQQQLRKATRMKLPDEQKQRVKQLYDRMHNIIGDFHRTHEHPQQQVFERQLTELRMQTQLFEKFEKCASLSKDGLSAAVGRLRAWFEEMPRVELRDPQDHGMLAETLSYLGVSRRELYDVYAAVLLLEKYGNSVDNTHEIVDKLNSIFYGDENEARKFLTDIQNMKAKEITARVNQLVNEKIISSVSRKHDLWQVLHDYGLYDKSESNWNMQVK
ncbi:MAG: HIRAN domain-containing protein [Prevotella sp.]|nr:HIRAN domain-containing protein [Prevotella sp.]